MNLLVTKGKKWMVQLQTTSEIFFPDLSIHNYYKLLTYEFHKNNWCLLCQWLINCRFLSKIGAIVNVLVTERQEINGAAANNIRKFILWPLVYTVTHSKFLTYEHLVGIHNDSWCLLPGFYNVLSVGFSVL